MNTNTQQKIEELMGSVEADAVIAVDHTKVHELTQTAVQVADLTDGVGSGLAAPRGLNQPFAVLDEDAFPPKMTYESNPAGPGHDLVKEQYLRGETPHIVHYDDFGFVPMEEVANEAEALERDIEQVFGESEPPVEEPTGELVSPETDAIRAGVNAGLLRAQNAGKTVANPPKLTAEQMKQLIKKFPQLKGRLKKALKQANKAGRPSWRR